MCVAMCFGGSTYVFFCANKKSFTGVAGGGPPLFANWSPDSIAKWVSHFFEVRGSGPSGPPWSHVNFV